MESSTVSAIKRDFIRNLVRDGKRDDGRGFMDQRNLTIKTNFVSKAQGSARVTLGKTQVVAGVKIQLEKPYPDTGNRGNFMTSAELNPIASPNFEPGPPRVQAIELARVTDRSLRESGLMDLEALCVVPNEKVWAVFVDISVLDYDGNLFDACSIAGVAAILSAKLPAVCPKTKEKVYEHDMPMPLKVENAAFSTTFAKIDGKIMVDPSLYEELVCDTKLTIGLDRAGNVRAMQKGGYGAFTVDEVKEIRRTAEKLGDATYKVVQKAVKSA